MISAWSCSIWDSGWSSASKAASSAETGFGFAFENEGVGEEAVTGCVLRDAEFALGRDRPGGMDGVERRDAFSLVRDRTAGFGAVCARGGDAKF